MLNWDSLIPSSIPAKSTHDVPHAGREMQENPPDLHKKAAFVPVCPSEKPLVSHLAGQPKPAPLLASGGFVPVVPVVPLLLQGVGSLDPENTAPGGGQEVENFAPENQGTNVSHPLHPAAVCLVVAACERTRKSPEEIGRHVLSLHGMAPAEQVRHWHGVCLARGVVPWRVLAFESQGEGKDCGMCVHLHSILDYLDGDKRRCFRWACKLGYLILEYGRATERIMLAPPECNSWERHYPGAAR